MRWRVLFIEGPARLVDLAWRGYWVLIAALAILCFTNAALWLAASLLGFPLP